MNLSPMQAAYWVGREATGLCSGVSAHLYTELDGTGIEAERLAQAVRDLVQTHPMLRMRITPAGQQVITPLSERHQLHIEDLRPLGPEASEARLAEIRHRMTHQRLDPGSGQCFEIRLSLLAGGRHRLHLDLDMIAADPSCFSGLLDDLSALYTDPGDQAPRNTAEGCYFDYRDQLEARPDAQKSSDQAREWWAPRLAQLPPPPALPWRLSATGAPPQSDSLAATLSPTQADALSQIARRSHVTPTCLYMSVFAAILGRACDMQCFRLSLPTFVRTPVFQGVDRLAGDFSNLTLVGFDLDATPTLKALTQTTQERMIDGLTHLAVPGVNLLGDLMRQAPAACAAPVVFTSDLNQKSTPLVSPRAEQVLGRLTYTVSQAPKVALDIQVAPVSEGVLINWDWRREALPASWLMESFRAYVTALTRLSEAPECLDQPLEAWMPATPKPPISLPPLLQAYVHGRAPETPLGGIPMQDMRLYRGAIDAAALSSRLAETVARTPALRQRLNVEDLSLTCGEDAAGELRQRDLSGLSPDAAEAELAAQMEAFAHHRSAPTAPLWELELFHLPGGENALLARFDALLLDGAGISALLRNLLAPNPADTSHNAGTIARTGPTDDPAQSKAYWQQKLAAEMIPTPLPWQQDLARIRGARWRRQAAKLSAADLKSLRRLGATDGMFLNSVLVATVLEALARWTPDLALWVAIPVAPPTADTQSNASSFLALHYDATTDAGFGARIATVQQDIANGMAHISGAGVDLSRLAMARNGGQIPFPVVITNGLGWERLPSDTPIRCTDGLTQTPQIALDIRLTRDEEGGLTLALDHVEQALAPDQVQQIRDRILDTLSALASQKSLPEQIAVDIGADPFATSATHPSDEVEAAWEGTGYLTRIAQNLETAGTQPAVIQGDSELSYDALARRVSLLRGAFAEHGLAPGAKVAICLPRGPAHLATALACAFSELIWVPIDYEAPDARRAALLQSARPDLVVTDAPTEGFAILSPEISEGPTPALPAADALERLSRSTSMGYALFTSGTTGRPKQVALSNRATGNTLGHTLQRWSIGPQDRVMSVTPLHHDMSLFDLFGTLTAGATLVMPAAAETRDALAWNTLVARHGVTVWVSVPAIVEMLLACSGPGTLLSLRLVAQGGDYIKPAIVDRLRSLLPNAALWSLGGPTETTIWSIWHEITPQDRQSIPYGRALPGNRYAILNALGEPCPPGVEGRIHTLGTNLALGYLEDGALSQKDFITVTLPGQAPERAFRTGDLGRYRPDGVILFGRRVDAYIKVRGVRVSTGDIAAELSHHPALSQICVVDLEDPVTGDTTLAALCVAKGTAPTPADMRDFMSERLPRSHRPDHILNLSEIPLSSTGKPDLRRAREIAHDVIWPPTPADPVLAACTELAGARANTAATAQTPLATIGLLPSQFAALAGRLAAETGLSVTPMDILQSRTCADLTALLLKRGWQHNSSEHSA